MKELSLWRWLSHAQVRLGKDLHLCRVENGDCSPGFPDVEGCYKGTQFFLELKVKTVPVRERTPIRPKFQKSQPNWHRKRLTAGGRSFILFQLDRKTRLLFPSQLIPQLQAGMNKAQLLEASLVPVGARQEEIIHAAIQ